MTLFAPMTSARSLIASPSPADAAALRASIAHCRAMVSRSGSSFTHGMRLIPEPLRSDTFVLYSWFRHADDLADDGDATPAEREAAIERFWDRTVGSAESCAHEPRSNAHDAFDPIWPALTDLLERRRLPLALFRAAIDGQRSDLRPRGFSDFESLRAYCFNVASSVGLLCVELWGFDGSDEARTLAEERGVAFQLTNILRDLRADALAGRVYLPASEAGRALSPADVLAGGCAVQHGVARLIERAARSYAISAGLDSRVDPSARRCLWAMTERYRMLLNKIAADPQAAMRDQPVRLSAGEKCSLLMRAVLR